MRPTILSLASSTRRGISSENQQSINPSTSPRQSRQHHIALQPRDSNAMMRAPQKGAPLSIKSGNAMPPYEKQNGAPRPVMPTLSAAVGKTINKTPLTPRVAGSNSTLPTNLSARRTARQGLEVTPTPSYQDDISTPVSAFLNNNITPRSSSRKTRVDSANSTPTHTPIGTPVPELWRIANDPPIHGNAGLNISGLEYNAPKKPTVSFSPAVSEIGSPREQPQSGGDAKFFYASDAKITIQAPRRQRPELESKTSSFLYANGETVAQTSSSSASAVDSMVGSAIGEDRMVSKFYRADGTPELSSQPLGQFPIAGSVISNSPYPAPRLALHTSNSVPSPSQRPTSPTKSSQIAAFPTIKHAATLPSPTLPRSQMLPWGHTSRDSQTERRKSVELSARGPGHERSVSVEILDLSPPSRKLSGATRQGASSPSSSLNITTAGLVSTPEDSSSEIGNDAVSLQSGLQSPIKAGHMLEHMNELAANARRERKVLDLEITNSSLAAINRTLEREMRKQTAELRRYRRLSRSGRLSIATTASMRSSNGTSMIDGTEGDPLSDMSEESETDEEEISEGESMDDGSLSPRAMAESDARHRKRDEKRLMLDLSKHQQLLIDSQNMNQSLKRCLGWTEELINEGKKALAYHVRVSDIEFGGRVLARDDIEEPDHDYSVDRSSIELSQAIENSIMRGSRHMVGADVPTVDMVHIGTAGIPRVDDFTTMSGDLL